MTRINDDSGVRETQTREQERANERRNQEKSQTQREEFARLVGQKQEQTAKSNRDQARARGEQTGQQSAASAKLLARQGIQANTFQSTLQNKGQQSLGDKQVQSKSRDTESRETKKAGENKDADIQERRVDRQGDKLAAISRDDRREGRGEKDDGGGGGKEMGGRDGFGAAGQGVAEAKGAQVHGAEAAAQAAPKLPAEVIRQIVERVMVGVNKEGLSEFRIELKDNVLGGTALSLSAKDGKIFAKFETRDQNVKRLIQASEGELARAFESKGLRLERLEVVGP